MEARKRITKSSFCPFQREDDRRGLFRFSALACWAMLSAQVVLPIEGRAAMMIRLPGWKTGGHLAEFA